MERDQYRVGGGVLGQYRVGIGPDQYREAGSGQYPGDCYWPPPSPSGPF
jgi:hypothetical protein